MKLADISGQNKEYPKDKIYELESFSKIKNIRDLYRRISDFKKGYQPRTNIVKDEKGGLVTDSLSIWARWRNHFSHLLNVRAANYVRQTENIQQSHYGLRRVPLSLRWLLKNLKGTDHQVLIKFQQNLLKQAQKNSL